MKQETLQKALPIVFTAILFFMVGWYAHTPTAPQNDVAKMVANMKPGDTLTFNERDIQQGGFEQGESYAGPVRTKDATEKKWYGRWLSWMQGGAVEAAAGDQGIQTSDGDFSIGKSKGPSWLAKLWYSINNWFWVFVFLGLGSVVVYFIVPAARPIISMVGKWLLGIVTGGISWVALHLKQGAALVNTQATATSLQTAVDKFPSLVQALPARATNETGDGFTQGQKDSVISLHQQTHTV
jgi:hypothetical protein